MSQNENMKKKEEKEVTEEAFVANRVKKTATREAYNAETMRNKYDDVIKREKYKNEQFGEKQTIIDPYSGDTIHKSSHAAKNKYGKAKYNKHTSHTDHTVPMAEAYKRTRDNVFLSEEDIKSIANNVKNYKIINGYLNQSKGSNSNIKTAIKNIKNIDDVNKAAKMITEQVKAETFVNADILGRSVNGAYKIGVDAAKSGVIIGGGISAVQHMASVLEGEEDAVDATLGIAIDTAHAGATSFGTSIATKGAEGALKKLGHKASENISCKALESIGKEAGSKLIAFAESNELGKAVVVTIEAGKSVKRYLDGEIDGPELVIELGEKGTGLAASFACGVEGVAIGGAAGGIIGGLIGSAIPGAGTAAGAAVGVKCGAVVGEIVGNMVGYMIGTEIYHQVIDYYKSHDIEMLKKETLAYNMLAVRIEQYRKSLDIQFEEIHMRNTQTIMDAFDSMRDGILNNNVDEFTSALKDICELYGQDIAFKTNKEFIEFWNDSNAIMEI